MNVGFYKCEVSTDPINQSSCVMISNNGYDPNTFFQSN